MPALGLVQVARDLGVAVNTAKAWIAVLEATGSGGWRTLVGPEEMEAMLQPPDSTLEAFAPVVIAVLV